MGRRARDLTKEGPFSRLRAIQSLGRKYGGNAYFLCVCECGGFVEARGSHLTSGNVQSCGCLQVETGRAVGNVTGGWNKTHGYGGTPEYSTWNSMIDRCTRPTCALYHRYGGRGISVCGRWMEFPNFLADMGHRPDGLSIDRIDNDGNYEPTNCRWATRREQGINKSTNVHLTHDGVTLTLVEWAEKAGINQKTLWYRLNVAGWSVSKALDHYSEEGDD